MSKFIVVEGIDGSGKSTLAQALAHHYISEGHPVVLTKEPGGTSIGQGIRKIVDDKDIYLDPYTELLLFAADRAQHMSEVIKPALQQEKIVISDRYKYSTIAYQGYGRGLDKSFIEYLNNKITKHIEPDIIFYCSIDPQQALQNCLLRDDKKSRFEDLGLTFFEYALLGFEEIFKNDNRVIYIDANKSMSEMIIQAIKVL